MRAPIGFLFTIFTFFTACLRAEDPFSQTLDLQTPSVELTDGLPNNIVNRTVSVISGEYIDNALDLDIKGPLPIVLSRTYSSFIGKGTLHHGWNHSLVKGVIAYKSKHKKKDTWALSLKEHHGATYTFIHPLERKNEKIRSIPFNLVFPLGLTNGSDEVSGRTNIKNTKIFYNHEKKLIQATSGAGYETTYKQANKNGKKYLYLATKEKDLRNHTYDTSEIGKFITLNSTTKNSYCKLHIKQNKKFDKDSQITVETSDERQVNYKFNVTKWKTKVGVDENVSETNYAAYYLSEVNKSHAPCEKYEYSATERNSRASHIKKKLLPQNRFLATEYYKKGSNKLEGPVGTIKITEKTDYRLDRVKSQMAPVGLDATPITTHRYVYDAKFKTRSSGAIELESGVTEAYDAYWHKTEYQYNKEQRLQRVRRFLGDQDSGYQCHSFEGFDWGEKDTPLQGSLLSKYMVDWKTYFVQGGYHYSYDDGGNVLNKSLFGKLTGTHSPIIILDRYKVVENGYERDNTSYTYSQEGFNLVKTETDSNGNTYYYNYLPGTDLLKEKFLVSENYIQQREYYTYNDDSVLTKKILDDGRSLDENDLSYVSERQITHYYPQKIIPIGLCERMDEMFLDLQTGQEILLKRTLYRYTKQGQLTSQEVHDSHGNLAHVCTFEYNAHGKVTKEVNTLGQVIKKDYDENDNLIMQEGPHPDYKIENTYDFSNRLVFQEEIHKDGSRYKISNRYNYLNQRIASTNTYGHETLYTYNDLGQIIATRLPAVANENNVLVHPILTSEFDVCGFPSVMTDAKGGRSTIENNIRGQPLCMTFPDGTQERYHYRLDGKLTQKIAREGTKTVYNLDPRGRILVESIYGADGQYIKAIQRTYNSFHLISETDSEGLTIKYTYDAAGRLHQTFKNDQLFKRTHYDSMGRVSVEEDWYDAHHFRLTTKTYDALDRIIEQKILSPDLKVHKSEIYSYDCLGNKTIVNDGGQMTQTVFNSQDNPIKIIDAEGNTSHIVYNTAFRNEHGQNVLQTTTSDALGNQTIDTYDTANRLTQTMRKNPLGVIISNQKILYDLCGNTIQVIDDVIYEGKTIRSHLTRYNYTLDNKVEWIIEAAGTPEQKTTFYHYNCRSQKCAKIKPDGVHILYDYDPLGRLHVLSSSDASLHYVYEYNQRDQVTQITDHLTGEVTQRAYDRLGNLSSERLGNGLIFNYKYDQFERPLSIVLPDQSAIEYVYDAANLKAIHRIQDNEKIYSHTFDEYSLSGVVTKATLPGQAGNQFGQYDKLNRCINIQSKHFNQTVPQGGYSPIGNLLSYSTNQQNYTFTFDDLSQIKSEVGHATHKYENDSLSNRLDKDGVRHEHNHLNQLISRGQERYVYDANGNLSKKIKGNQLTVYTYDALDRLIKIKINDAETEYCYDPFHRRLSKQQLNKSATLFLYQGDEEIGTWEEGRIKQLKILSNNQRKSVAVELEGIPHVSMQDFFGNSVNLVNLQGDLVENYRYTAFGEVEVLDSRGARKEATANPWGYSNKRLDIESGLVAYGLRFYDPDLGRWLCPDPAGYEDGANLYAHVHNNPMKYYDMLGLFSLALSTNPNNFDSKLPNFDERRPESTWESIKNSFSDTFFHKDVYHLNELENKAASTYFNKATFHFPNLPNKAILFTNGIDNTLSDFKNSLIHTGNLANHNIIGVFDPTLGFAGDSVHYLASRFLYIGYDPVKNLHREWDLLLKNKPENATILVQCHSRGAVNVRNALMTYPPELRSRILVLAVAPGCYIDRELCGGVKHLVSSKDPVANWTDMAGYERCKSTIQVLIPHPNACQFFDHSFTSPTYKEPIRLHSNNYLKFGTL